MSFKVFLEEIMYFYLNCLKNCFEIINIILFMEQIKMHFDHFFQFFIQNHLQIIFLSQEKNQFFNFFLN